MPHPGHYAACYIHDGARKKERYKYNWIYQASVIFKYLRSMLTFLTSLANGAFQFSVILFKICGIKYCNQIFRISYHPQLVLSPCSVLGVSLNVDKVKKNLLMIQWAYFLEFTLMGILRRKADPITSEMACDLWNLKRKKHGWQGWAGDPQSHSFQRSLCILDDTEVGCEWCNISSGRREWSQPNRSILNSGNWLTCRLDITRTAKAAILDGPDFILNYRAKWIKNCHMHLGRFWISDLTQWYSRPRKRHFPASDPVI